MSDDAVLSVTDLHTRVATRAGFRTLVHGATLSVRAGETLGVIGESGSGKSVMVRSIMDLLTRELEVVDRGAVRIEGVPVLTLPAREARKYWGPVISMVFQDPRLALNPVRTIGAQLTEPMRLHLHLSRAQARARALDLLREVGLPDPQGRLQQYPHELSGGMCQRVMIALALCCEPKVLIADEPTSALDMTVQRQILELIRRLSLDREMATVLITHDMGVVAHFADRVAVMSKGHIVEQGAVRQVLLDPRHEYTRTLFGSIPPALSGPEPAPREAEGTGVGACVS